jgi:hypothetical protein
MDNIETVFNKFTNNLFNDYQRGFLTTGKTKRQIHGMVEINITYGDILFDHRNDPEARRAIYDGFIFKRQLGILVELIDEMYDMRWTDDEKRAIWHEFLRREKEAQKEAIKDFQREADDANGNDTANDE